MCRELGLQQTEMAQRGLEWLVDAQLVDGSWGLAPSRPELPTSQTLPAARTTLPEPLHSSVEESSLALEALAGFHGLGSHVDAAVARGVGWLAHAIQDGQHHNPAPIGFYFANLWYHERLYPQIFATRALHCAIHNCLFHQKDPSGSAARPQAVHAAN